MRVSNIGLTSSAIAAMQRSAREVEQAQRTTQTGLRVERPSDDPVAAVGIMSSDSSLRALTQYRRNIDTATVRTNLEEEVLDRVSQALERAKQLGIQEGSSTGSAQTRTVAKAEIDELLAFIIQQANTRHEGEYLFGGDQSSVAPVSQSTPPFTTATPTGTRRAEVSENFFVDANHNADQIFLSSGTLAALDALSTALGANDQPGILSAIDSVDAALATTQQLIGDVGARTNVFETTGQNLAALETTTRTFKSDLQDADLEEAVTRLVTRQNAYQAALLATSRVVSLSLADYLR